MTNKKIAIVTGAGSGIGRAVTVALNQDGWTTVLAGRRTEQLNETAQSCDPSRALMIPTDITQPSGVKNLFDITVQKFGRVDLLFNNAGVNVAARPIEELSFEEWQVVINTNLTGAFLCAQ